MKIIEVKDKKDARKFLDVVDNIYTGDENYIRPLDIEVENVFTPDKNVFFTHGDACRWYLENEQGKTVGRVAAFINEKKAYNYNQPTGGMGFFECIRDKDAAFLLFDQCKKWLENKGMKAMDGPINFGENDNFWGLLVEGFTPPSYGMNYHPSYYKEFFEEYGFKPYFEQVTNKLDLTVPFPERFWKIAEWVLRKPGYECKHFKYSEAEKFITDLKSVYDEAWKFHENFTPINKEDLYKQLEKAKPILIEEFIWFAYFEGKPIAFLVMFPDANQIFKYFGGKLNFWNKLRFLILKNQKKISRTRITVMGVVPEFQRKGIESAIFKHMHPVMKKRPQYTEIELSWVGDFNPKMRALHDAVGGDFSKRHITYRIVFGQKDLQSRYETIPVDTKYNNH
ncbi:MAG: GNAT family N-acetyltransferase [Bacteroidales bacterium]|nr:GNAT family N-acetyltransferase [Bacteroidales bacterium]MCF8387847.1 GNAT family N-acetyltransferase [Bacteroidales bacterium]MCF8397347.1 GNAT family N-acetyltransferase [Bacteroidales bacterium]